MPEPPVSNAARELELDEVAALAAYDERLRHGEAAPATPTDGATQTTGIPGEFVECLQLIEQVWPRGERRPTRAGHLPAKIGRFEIDKVLGQGGFGIVYLARDPRLGRQVALKVPRLHALANEGLQQRFRREARATAALDHPHIVRIHETGEDGPLSYIAFAYCEGPSLAQWLKVQAADVPPETAALLVKQLAEAVHYSHRRGVLHRDLKPSNVLLFPVSEEDRERMHLLPFVPRIVDFGLARVAEEELEATGTSGVIGTPLYMAPEQALGATDAVGPAADLYALGVILYELLCNQPPFVGVAPLEVLDQVRHAEPPSIRKQRPDVPQDLETICLKCLRKQPEDRYATAQGLAEDLGRFLEGKDVAAQPVTVLQRLVRWCQRPQRITEAGATMIVIQLSVIVSQLLTNWMASTGLIPSPANSSGINPHFFSVTVVLVTHVPLALIGLAVMKRHAWAIYLALVTGAAMTAMATAFISGVIPLGTLLWDDIPGFRVIYGLMAVLFALQTLASIVAWMALMRQRVASKGRGQSAEAGTFRHSTCR